MCSASTTNVRPANPSTDAVSALAGDATEHPQHLAIGTVSTTGFEACPVSDSPWKRIMNRSVPPISGSRLCLREIKPDREDVEFRPRVQRCGYRFPATLSIDLEHSSG